jgi:hypothetical protein
MTNLITGTWAVILLAFLFLCTHTPPRGPSPAIVAGQDEQLTFFEAFCERVDPTADLWEGSSGQALWDGKTQPRYSKTPCGRTTHIRSWSDTH